LKPVAEEVEAVGGVSPEEVLPAMEDSHHGPAVKRAAGNRAERYQEEARNDVIKQRIGAGTPGEITGAARKIARNGRIRTGKIFRTKDAIARKTGRTLSKMSMMIIGMTVILFMLVLRSVLQQLEQQPT
jgi:hypothetical protein